MAKMLTLLSLISLAAISFALTPVQSRGPGETKLRRAKGKPIRNQYIVVLKGSVSEVEHEASQLTQEHGGRPFFIYRYAFKGFSAQMTEAQATRLANHPRVQFVEEDGEATPTRTQTGATWGLDRIDQRNLPLDGNYNFESTGAGVTAYIIDSGIRSTHVEFGGRVAAGFSAIDDGNGTEDCNGHGTHVAGTVGSATYGVAKDVTLVPVRIFGCMGGSPWSTIIAGIDWVTRNHTNGAPAVANMSLSGSVAAALDLAVSNSISDGITYVVAAGNNAANACLESPARIPTAITVGATGMNDTRSGFSNTGACLDIFAPGGSITSTWSGTDTETAIISGTSMASPHVAGAAALFLATNPNAPPVAVAEAIISSATLDKVTDPQNESPNRLLFVGTAGSEVSRRRIRDDLFLYRPGMGAVSLLRSNGNGTFTTTLAVGDNGSDEPNGIGGYDLLSQRDKVFPFDFDGDGNDDLFLYRPGAGAVFVLKATGNGNFLTVGQPVGDNGSDDPNGIGGYDLLSPDDQVFPFDFDGDGKDDLFLYRPGTGAVFVLKSNGDGNFTAVGQPVGDNGSDEPNGIGGYNLLSPRDKVFPFDFNGDGKDDLFLYRPGTGAVFVLKSNGDGNFTAVGQPVGDNGSDLPNGIGGYDLLSANDQVFSFDFNADGKDDLCLFRPGTGAVFVLKSNGDGNFVAVGKPVGDNGSAEPNGIGGYDLLSPQDKVFPFDFDGDGTDDLFLYRPGMGAVFVLRSNGDGNFTAVGQPVGDNGSDDPNGIGGYDLLSPNDQVFPFDFDRDRRHDLLLYRPGTGAVFVLKSNGDGNFTAVGQPVGDNGADEPNGIGGYDLLSPLDRVFPLNYTR